MTKKHTIATLAAVLGLALTGCSAGESGSDALQIDVPEIPKMESLGDNEKQLNIVAWSGFVEPQWADKFTQDTGCTVNRKIAATSDEMVQLMRTGEYDLVSASGDASLRLIVDGNVQPLNTDLIPNFGDDIVEGMKGQLYDTLNGNVYGIPIGRGANILQYNTDVVSPAPDSWSVVWEKDSPYAGRIAAYDSPIYIADAALYLKATQPELGITNPYALDEKQLAAAIDLLKNQNAMISEYWSPSTNVTSFTGGNSVVGTSWEVLRKAAQDDKFQAVLPKEGATGWSDAWMLAADAKNPNCAYRWMDYTSSPEVNGQIAMNFGMAPANAAFCDLNAEAAAHCADYHATDEDYYSKVWFWTTPIAPCLDGRTDVKCTSYQDWSAAWPTVKG